MLDDTIVGSLALKKHRQHECSSVALQPDVLFSLTLVMQIL